MVYVCKCLKLNFFSSPLMDTYRLNTRNFSGESRAASNYILFEFCFELFNVKYKLVCRIVSLLSIIMRRIMCSGFCTHTRKYVTRTRVCTLNFNHQTRLLLTRIVVLCLDIIKRSTYYKLPYFFFYSTLHPLHAGRRQLPTLSPLLDARPSGRGTPAGEEKER